MSLVTQNDIDQFYQRLNAVRSKFGLSSLSKPSTAVTGQMATYSDIKTVPDKMTQTSQQSSYIPNKTYIISGLMQYGKITQSQKTEIEAHLSQLEGICRHDASNYTANYTSNYTSNYISDYMDDRSDDSGANGSDDKYWCVSN